MLSLKLSRIAIPIWRCEPVCYLGSHYCFNIQICSSYNVGREIWRSLLVSFLGKIINCSFCDEVKV